MNLHRHSQPDSHIVLDSHICNQQGARRHREGPCMARGHCLVCKMDAAPTSIEVVG